MAPGVGDRQWHGSKVSPTAVDLSHDPTPLVGRWVEDAKAPVPWDSQPNCEVKVAREQVQQLDVDACQLHCGVAICGRKRDKVLVHPGHGVGRVSEGPVVQVGHCQLNAFEAPSAVPYPVGLAVWQYLVDLEISER